MKCKPEVVIHCKVIGDKMYSAYITEVTKEFGEDKGVIYVDKTEDVLEKARGGRKKSEKIY